MTATIVDKTTCSRCGSEPRIGKSSWGRLCINANSKDARDRRKAGLPARPRGRPKKSQPDAPAPRTEPIRAAISEAIARHQVVSEATASVALDNDSDLHTCHEGHCAPAPEPVAEPVSERTERTPGHGVWCAGMCCRVAPQA